MVALQVLVDLDVAGSTRGSMELDEVEVDLPEVELLLVLEVLEAALARGRLPVEGLFCASCSSPPLGPQPLVVGPCHVRDLTSRLLVRWRTQSCWLLLPILSSPPP